MLTLEIYLVPGVALAVLLVAHAVAPRRARDPLLAVASVAVVAWLAPLAAVLLAAGALAVYLLAPRSPAAWPILGLVAVLAWFKYVPAAIAAIEGGNPALVAVPLGLSYYTFKLIHYVLEQRRANLPGHDLAAYLAWLFLPTTFTAGPIERFDHFLENRRDRARLDDVAEGATRILYGVIKKFALAPLFDAPLVRLGGAEGLIGHLDEISPVRLWGVVAGRYLYLYLDFSAYTDFAVGASRLFGIRIMENFRWPLIARNIGDFWGRWHMTLSGWCQNYIYLPVIGIFRKPRLAIFASFLAIGLWHAGTLHFVLWGLYHAIAVVVYRTVRRRRGPPAAPRGPGGAIRVAAAILATQLFVAASFALTLPFGTGSALDGVRTLLALFGIRL